jgi:hypothetical protein
MHPQTKSWSRHRAGSLTQLDLATIHVTRSTEGWLARAHFTGGQWILTPFPTLASLRAVSDALERINRGYRVLPS